MIVKDIPLIGFTLLSQMSAGLLVLYNIMVFLPTFRNKGRMPAWFKTIPLTAFILGISAMIFSIFHLGHPLKAAQSLNNLSSSWLSREILFMLLFLFFNGSYVFMIFRMSEWKRLMLVFLNLGSLLGIVLVYSMSRVYTDLPVPAWQPIFTFLNFSASAIATGGIVLLLFLTQKGSLSAQRSLSWILAIIFLLEIAAIPVFLSYLDQNSLTSQQSLKILLDDYGIIFYIRLAFQVLSLVFIFTAILNLKSNIDENKKLLWPVIMASACIFLSEISGRILFYAVVVPLGGL